MIRTSFPTRSLAVRHEGKTAGFLFAKGGELSFRYEPEWVDEGFPLSCALPLSDREYGDERTRTYFENLIPEGSILKIACAAKKIARGDVFSFLEAYGGECAGAFAIGEARPGGPARDVTNEIRKYLDAKMGGSLFAVARARLSLGGAQDKLPVVFKNGRIFLPAGGEPTTHIIKPDIPGYPHSARNEHFCLSLARELGCAACESGLAMFPEGELFVVKRFDRVLDGKKARRLHQEDFCQAMGLSGGYKYQRSGGYDGVANLISVCGKAGAKVGDFFARAMILNYLVGNCDGHAKNFAILHENRNAKIAPLYDVLSTAVYPGLDRDLGMAFGNSFFLDEISAKDFPAAARDCGISAPEFAGLAREMASQCGKILPKLLNRHKNEYSENPVYEHLKEHIGNACENTLRFSETGGRHRRRGPR